ncbi:MAG: DAHL domain-containing protein [Gammaproteobacteria bacterium]
MSRRRLAGAFVLLSLTVLLAWLFNRTQAVDIERENRVMLGVREFEKLDARWNVDILRSHIGANANYDPLSAPLPRMHLLLQRLEGAVPATDGAGARQAVATLAQALREKEDLVEQFKSLNAILRNSQGYFPAAVADLKTELKGVRGAERLDAALNLLLTDTLRYTQAPTAALAQRIEALLAAVSQSAAPLPPALGARVQELDAHARIILRYRALENALEARIAAVPTGQASERLALLFDRAYDQKERDRQRFRGYLFVYSGVLLVLLAYAGWRLRRSYRIIGAVNSSLKAANETLEARVAERTAELEAQSARLRQMALHDALTGLINYAELKRRLDHALVRGARRDTITVLMFIDLDGFKAVNDTHGHGTGDLVLKQVAKRVQDKLRKEDSFARLGGDEFVVLLEEVTSREGALRVAEQTLEQIRSVTEAGGHPVRISASIGVASARGPDGAARGPDALLAEADQAMYQAKQGGKNAIAVSAASTWGAEPAVLAG